MKLKLGERSMVAVDSVLQVLAIVEAVFAMSNGFVINVDDRDGTTHNGVIPGNIIHRTSVQHYARHGLCRTFSGKQHFYKAMKEKFCNIKRSFTGNFVMDLCRRRNQMLDKWVSELFDIDGDGYISHFERNFYNYDD